jgi:hypothetical protein
MRPIEKRDEEWTAARGSSRGAWAIVLLTLASVACRGSGAAAVSPDGGAAGGTTGAAGTTPSAAGSGGGGAAAGAAGASPGTAGVGAAGAAGAGSGGAPPTTAVTYEAERAFSSGAVKTATTTPGFTGAGFADGLAGAADRVVFTVFAAAAGPHEVTLRHRNGNAASVRLAVTINGERSGETTLAPTGASFAAHVQSWPLRAGLNTIAYSNDAGAPQALALDNLALSGGLVPAARGATLPFVTTEAEDARTNGTLVGPDRKYGAQISEASGRRAVKLVGDDAYLELVASEAANALVLRSSIPDAPAGGGLTGKLGVFVDGARRATLQVSSRYAWVYGGYPYDDDPAHLAPHHFFDESRVSLGEVPAGAVVRLAREAGDATAYYLVDLIELERAPAAYAAPAGALPITSYGAKPDDDMDDTQALRAAIADAKVKGKPVWIPAGEFSVRARVDVDHVTIRGAGPWHSVLRGSNGKGGFNGTGGAVQLLDFALMGDVRYRDDAGFDAGVDGTLGPGSLVQNVWFEHTKVGIWTIKAESTLIAGCRVRDTFADGINLTNGTRGTVVEHTHVRNTGDDGLAMWSTGTANASNVFRFVTVQLPMLANGAAIYGGADNRIEDAVIADTLTAAAGVAISTRSEFGPLPFTGTTRVERVTLTRTGGYEENWKTSFGGLWIFADLSGVTSGLVVRDVDVVDSTYQGVLLSGAQPVRNATFERVAVRGAGTAGLEIATPGAGAFTDVSISGAATAATVVPAFTVTKSNATGW